MPSPASRTSAGGLAGLLVALVLVVGVGVGPAAAATPSKVVHVSGPGVFTIAVTADQPYLGTGTFTITEGRASSSPTRTGGYERILCGAAGDESVPGKAGTVNMTYGNGSPLPYSAACGGSDPTRGFLGAEFNFYYSDGTSDSYRIYPAGSPDNPNTPAGGGGDTTPTPEDAGDCGFTLNPLTATKCALEWAFVPSPDSTAKFSQLGTDFENAFPFSMVTDTWHLLHVAIGGCREVYTGTPACRGQGAGWTIDLPFVHHGLDDSGHEMDVRILDHDSAIAEQARGFRGLAEVAIWVSFMAPLAFMLWRKMFPVVNE